MNVTCRWLDKDSDNWHRGTLLGFITMPGVLIGGGIIAMVATRTGRIVEMDYTRLRVGEVFDDTKPDA